MPKCKCAGDPVYFPKRMPQIDRDIITKVIEVRNAEKSLLFCESEILQTRKQILNLEARKREIEKNISTLRDELLKLYDDKIWKGTVCCNR